MTSAEFRTDCAAHVENMRAGQKNQQHMEFFRTLIEQNRHLFAGRRILVLHCGVGTLALLAARAGAARVYALDHSRVTDYARLVVKENHYEHIVTVLHGHVQDVQLPKEQQQQQEPLVDGIICNWMGYCLLYESQLVELLQARDRWLKPQGFILPDLASLYLLGAAELQLKNAHCNWWLGVHGFNMKALRRYTLAEPCYVRVQGERLLTLAHKILSLDLRVAQQRDLQIDRSIRLQVQHEGYCECFVLYFDVAFSRAHVPLKLSCNPWLRTPLKSLWLQTVLFVERPFVMRRDKCYTGHLSFRSLQQGQHLDLRRMRIDIRFYESFSLQDAEQHYSNTLVHKAWHMLPHFQSVQQVAECQDKY
ncbi:hypothetical protein KR222_002476 [Zaprionus bogoriensis]|nr:hypothetical protein KR222_002476 [Zaprionus bogoriensis]